MSMYCAPATTTTDVPTEEDRRDEGRRGISQPTTTNIMKRDNEDGREEDPPYDREGGGEEEALKKPRRLDAGVGGGEGRNELPDHAVAVGAGGAEVAVADGDGADFAAMALGDVGVEGGAEFEAELGLSQLEGAVLEADEEQREAGGVGAGGQGGDGRGSRVVEGQIGRDVPSAKGRVEGARDEEVVLADLERRDARHHVGVAVVRGGPRSLDTRLS
mmetsp:Transcript_7607/g.23499  ORF Transcript_7607/g.23499 Transcript_7607/m.23499 type:complete len:217 (-) Transcript_7607:919-1569(-)